MSRQSRTRHLGRRPWCYQPSPYPVHPERSSSSSMALGGSVQDSTWGNRTGHPRRRGWCSQELLLLLCRDWISFPIYTTYLCALYVPVRREADNLDHLSELCKILTGILHFLQSVADCVGLVDDLENSISHGGFMEEIIDLRHSARCSQAFCKSDWAFSIRMEGQFCVQFICGVWVVKVGSGGANFNPELFFFADGTFWKVAR